MSKFSESLLYVTSIFRVSNNVSLDDSQKILEFMRSLIEILNSNFHLKYGIQILKNGNDPK